LIEQAEALGEPPEDPLLLFSALDALFQMQLVAFDGDAVRKDAAQLLALARKQGGKVQLLRGHQAVASALGLTGSFAEGRLYCDKALALYDPVEHRPLTTQFLQDPRVLNLISRSAALWALGYPEAALADAELALSEARELGHAGALMHAITNVCLGQVVRGNHAKARALSDELIALAEEKGSAYWKATGMLRRGGLFALTGRPSDAVGILSSTIPAQRSIGVKLFFPVWLSLLARAYGELGQFDDAWSTIGEATTAVETTKETWYEAEVHRIAGEIAMMSPEPDTARAETSFERALAVARAQQARSWELRAAMCMARLWRDQGKRDKARNLLAPAYGWFTEGFDTPDLKQAKALIDELAT
jgi:predicted ATPase